ncbi:prepilin peptidase [Stieleria marina]|uniref:Leader peptidase PppA n=1 Tax=Stieleria marina TaxID=1930275 RepID=A0A517NPU8_9BACT|nr:Leader peptidase PppA [Planctomycetes bacterium K23_9]
MNTSSRATFHTAKLAGELLWGEKESTLSQRDGPGWLRSQLLRAPSFNHGFDALNRRRFRSRLPFLLVISSVAIVALAYIFGMAWWQSRDAAFFGADELWVPRSIDVLITLWLLWIGSAIGSFLNVVAWRMPRGVSINGRSRCPRCETALKPRDNFPVLGWLMLGGRCRMCKLPISPRYPIVEAAVGVSLALVGIAELYRLAIPHQWNHWHGGPFWAPVVDRFVIIVLIYHAVAVATSWALGLVRLDKQRLPVNLTVFALLAVVVPMLAYPTLMIVPWQTARPSGWIPDGLHIEAVMRVVSALVAAGLLGRSLASGLCPTADPKLDPLGQGTTRLLDLVVVIAVPAVVVGWQVIPAVVVVASLIALLLRKVVRLQSDMFGFFSLAMPIALTLQIVLWRRLHGAAFWPSDETSHWVILLWAAAALASPAWLREPPSKPERISFGTEDEPTEEKPTEEKPTEEKPGTDEPAAEKVMPGDWDDSRESR